MGTKVEEIILCRLRSAGGISVWQKGTAEFLISVMDSSPVPILLEVRHRFSESHIEELEALKINVSKTVVLVTQALSPRRREQLCALNQSWIEYQTGFVHLRAPGLAVDLPEIPSKATGGFDAAAVPSLAGKAGIVVEALVELAQEQTFVEQQEVAELSGSGRAWTSRVFGRLVAAGAMEVMSAGIGPQKKWRPDVDTLLDLWVKDGGPTQEATNLYVWVRDPEDLLKKLSELNGSNIRYAVGEVVAADLYEPTLTGRPIPKAWIPAVTPPQDFAKALGGEVVDTGANLIIWQETGDPALRLGKNLNSWKNQEQVYLGNLSLVSPARAFAESMAAPGRGSEVAESLKQTILRRSQNTNDRST